MLERRVKKRTSNTVVDQTSSFMVRSNEASANASLTAGISGNMQGKNSNVGG